MSKITKPTEKTSASETLSDAAEDFVLSRRAMLCSKRTINWYSWNLEKILAWMTQNGVGLPGELSAKRVRAYLASLAERKLSDSTINGNARIIRTFTRFMLEEEYIDKPVQFKMPTIAKKRHLCLSAKDVDKLIKACKKPRDSALILFMVDTGVRRAELCSLNWGDVDLTSGIVRVRRGKGGKARTVIVGASTRRALIRYRRLITARDQYPLFQTYDGGRLKHSGLRSLLLRVSKIAGVKVTPHALRRTFATLSLRAGMNILHLQGLMGHSSIEMTRKYIEMLEDDLVTAHQEHGPVDKFLRSR